MTWNYYKSGVYIAAGLSVAGTLWFARSGANIHAEDRAACLASMVERKHYAYAYGTNAVVIPTNYVSAYIEQKTLKDTAEGYRAMLLPDDDYYGASLYWLDATYPLPANNGYVSSFNDDAGEWSYTETINNGVSTRDMNRAAFRDGYPFFLTMDTRYTNSTTFKVRRFFGLSAINVPAVTWFYPSNMDNAQSGLIFDGAGNWWSYYGSRSTNLYTFPPMEYVGTNGLLHWSYYIETNTLYNIKTVANAMKRSVRVFNYDSLASAFTATSGVRVTGNYMTNANGASTALATLVSASKSGAVAGQSISTNVAFDGNLASMTIEANRSKFTPPLDPITYSAQAHSTFSKTQWLGVKAPYPCEDACKSGLVSRVRIFAVCEGEFCTQIENTQITNAGINVTSQTPDGNQGYAYDGQTLGTGMAIGNHSSPPNYNSSATQTYQFRYDSRPCVRHFWKLVLDVSNPTTQPMFSMGSAFDPTSISVLQTSTLNLFYQGTLVNEERVKNLYAQDIRIKHLFVIVDWAWQNLQ